MPDVPYLVQTLGLTGFRAYLQPKIFDFSKKRCLAIFAANGNGKSSVIDGLEFMFSGDGTLKRLGQRTINNQAGFIALAHNRADEAKIKPVVAVKFIQGKIVTDASRPAAGSKRPRPAIATTVNQCFVVDPIIRGHALRTFVEAHTPEQRYTDVATWLQLGPLADVQKNLRALRALVKADAESTDPLQRINTALAKESHQAVAEWNDDAVLAHIKAAILAPLDKALAMAALEIADPAYFTLGERVSAEAQQVGLAGLRQIRQAAAALWIESKDEETGEVVASGAIPAFESAVIALAAAQKAEADERGKAANAAFEAVWKAAEPLFAEGAANPDVCPICATPVDKTVAGGVGGIKDHIATHLAELAGYAAAKKALEKANTVANKADTRLGAALQSLEGLLGDNDLPLKAALATYRTAIDAWTEGDAPDAAPLIAQLVELIAGLDASIADIEARQGEHTYAKAKAKIDRLLDLQAEHLLAVRTQAELENLSQALNTQAATISAAIRVKVQTLLDRLQTPMNDIYKLVQGPAAAPIRLELPDEDDTNQQRLNLLVDFAENRVGVQPGGYLSDSQIHSLALALRLAAIQEFNRAAPIIALDDIVTSYDADHRRTIAGLFAVMFTDCQLLITTHDERFFSYLKDQLDGNTWQFTRIIGLDPAYGPRFADHKVTDEMIQARWDAGHSAANEMRQAEEEWLLGICRDFGANVRIRPLEKAYNYERSELASALAGLLKNAKLEPQQIAGVANRFLTSLQKGEIENFGSHFQDGPYGDGSIGDEKARWAEFKAFRDQFACPKCARTRFKRPYDLKKPVCANEGCEAQFEFPAKPGAT